MTLQLGYIPGIDSEELDRGKEMANYALITLFMILNNTEAKPSNSLLLVPSPIGRSIILAATLSFSLVKMPHPPLAGAHDSGKANWKLMS